MRWLAVAAALCGGCGARSELLVVLSTDLTLPSEADTLTVAVSDPDRADAPAWRGQWTIPTEATPDGGAACTLYSFYDTISPPGWAFTTPNGSQIVLQCNDPDRMTRLSLYGGSARDLWLGDQGALRLYLTTPLAQDYTVRARLHAKLTAPKQVVGLYAQAGSRWVFLDASDLGGTGHVEYAAFDQGAMAPLVEQAIVQPPSFVSFELTLKRNIAAAGMSIYTLEWTDGTMRAS